MSSSSFALAMVRYDMFGRSGDTWSGRGRAPKWIQDAKNRDKFHDQVIVNGRRLHPVWSIIEAGGMRRR
jgi:hypothetical protein